MGNLQIQYYTRNGKTNSAGNRPKVFISYRHNDVAQQGEGFIDGLIAQMLEASDCAVWYDALITGGAEYRDEIADALGAADLAVLLITHDSYRSDYMWETEIPRIEESGVHMLPILIDSPELSVRERYVRFFEENEGIQQLTYEDSEAFREQLRDSVKKFASSENDIIRQLFSKQEHKTPQHLALGQLLNMAKGYAKGIGTEKDEAAAEQWLDYLISFGDYSAAEKDSSTSPCGGDIDDVYLPAMIELGMLHKRRLNNIMKRTDKTGAADELTMIEALAERSCRLNDGTLARSLAKFYNSGSLGVERNADSLIYWLEKAMACGLRPEAKQLGLIYLNGEYGVEKAPEKALECFKNAKGKDGKSGAHGVDKLIAEAEQAIAEKNAAVPETGHEVSEAASAPVEEAAPAPVAEVQPKKKSKAALFVLLAVLAAAAVLAGLCFAGVIDLSAVAEWLGGLL